MCKFVSIFGRKIEKVLIKSYFEKIAGKIDNFIQKRKEFFL